MPYGPRGLRPVGFFTLQKICKNLEKKLAFYSESVTITLDPRMVCPAVPTGFRARGVFHPNLATKKIRKNLEKKLAFYSESITITFESRMVRPAVPTGSGPWGFFNPNRERNQ